MNTIEICYKNVPETDISEGVNRFCLEVLDRLKIKNREISIMLCDDSTIQDINLKYRSKNEPTDVLSFNQDLESAGDIIYAGDIVISLERIKDHS